jgi:transposase InsO family protein
MDDNTPGMEKPHMNWKAENLHREWERFDKHFKYYCMGPLSSKGEEVKIGYLLLFVGERGREIHEGVTLSDDDKKVLNKNLEVFKNYTAPRKNMLRASFKFHRRRQGETESFDDFVTDLRILMRDCGFEDKDRRLRDAIVFNCFHEKVREKCLDEGDVLNLDKVIDIGRTYEISQKGLQELKQGEDPTINAFPRVKKQPSSADAAAKSDDDKRKFGCKVSRKTKKCYKCGLEPKLKCPAAKLKCDLCGKKGHFKKVCRLRGKFAHAMDTTDSEGETSCDSSVEFHALDRSEDHKMDNEFYENVRVNEKHRLHVQLDTGSPINILPLSKLEKLGYTAKNLQPTQKVLASYTKDKMKPLGTITLLVRYKARKANLLFYIVELDQIPLLSDKACTTLGLIKRIHKTEVKKGGSKKRSTSQAEIEKLCPKVMQTTGVMPITVKIELQPDAQPVVHGPRNQPKALLPRIKAKLREMEADGYIKKVDEPTDWVSSMAVSDRKGQVRVCIDPSSLNKSIRRSIYPMKTIEEVISNLNGMKYFSTLDAKSGFCQLPLDDESSYLTTFNTPLGRFRWLVLPFGIKSAPEIYQRTMDSMLEGIDGATAIMDDIIIAGKTLEEHDEILKSVLQRATEWNVKLNIDKCNLRQQSIKYVGHIITDKGANPDPEKVRAIVEMPQPTTREEIATFLGFVTYLNKFIPKLSEVDSPLRDVMKSEVFFWYKPQELAFKKIKELCASASTLAYYDVNEPTVIQCDASSFGIGAALCQEKGVIAYTSRALNSTEQNYSQIQKELKAIEHACRKFHTYIYGKQVTIETDHQPLEAIFKKPIHVAPKRLQPMLLRLSIYDLTVAFKKGKLMYLADTLSRAPLPETVIQEEETMMVHKISISGERMKQFRKHTTEELSTLVTTILEGWPEEKCQVSDELKPYWNFRDELDCVDGVVYKGDRLVIPPSMRDYALQCIHTSHLGIEKCKSRARDSCYWPGINQKIEQLIENCQECQENRRKQRPQPMTVRDIPERPWAHCASDLFEYKGQHYVLVVDYFSKWICVEKLGTESSTSVISALMTVFTTHGFPDQLTTDNGPQYTSCEFKQFCREYNFVHVTTSPHYPQSNGEAERAVGTIKHLWKKTVNKEEKKRAIMEYNASAFTGLDLSPAQILMGRRIKSSLILNRDLLKPKQYSIELVRHRLQKLQYKAKEQYDKHARTSYADLKSGDTVLVRTPSGLKNTKPRLGKVISEHSTPQSFIVATGTQKVRRNRVDLYKCPEHFKAAPAPHTPKEIIDLSDDAKATPSLPTTVTESIPTPSPNKNISRSGRAVNKPIKFNDYIIY